MRNFALILGPTLFVISAALGQGDKVYVVVGTLLWMLVWWVSEVVHLGVAALIPMLVFPFFEVLDWTQVAASYGNRLVWLFFAGFVLARALEVHDIHRWLVGRVLSLSKPTVMGMCTALVGVTALLSMWISNTATTLMMLPLVLVIIRSLEDQLTSRQKGMLLMSIAFAANIGGTATLVGTPPNLQMASILESSGVTITFSQWLILGMLFAIPAILLLLVVVRSMLGAGASLPVDRGRFPSAVSLLRSQRWVLVVFGFVATLWMVRYFLNQWTGWNIHDTQIGLLGVILLLTLPVNREKEPLLEWSDVSSHIPWGILLLFGGGLCLASGMKETGLVDMLAQNLSTDLSPWFMILVVVAVGIFATEIMSNLALVTILVPILLELAPQLGFQEAHLVIPPTLAASCAFMLPVATPPNAIVFASGELSLAQMLRVGLLLNILFVGWITLCGLTLVKWLF